MNFFKKCLKIDKKKTGNARTENDQHIMYLGTNIIRQKKMAKFSFLVDNVLMCTYSVTFFFFCIMKGFMYSEF